MHHSKNSPNRLATLRAQASQSSVLGLSCIAACRACLITVPGTGKEKPGHSRGCGSSCPGQVKRTSCKYGESDARLAELVHAT